jgi:hypothetical protein
MGAAPPRLALVVATDRFETISLVVDHRRAQTIASPLRPAGTVRP